MTLISLTSYADEVTYCEICSQSGSFVAIKRSEDGDKATTYMKFKNPFDTNSQA